MNAYGEASCPNGHKWLWKNGTPFICPVCKHTMQPGKQPGKVGLLTEREEQVVALIGEGFTNRQIAERLIIEECTVENHVHRIMRKLGLTSRVQIARYAWEHDIKAQDPASSEPPKHGEQK